MRSATPLACLLLAALLGACGGEDPGLNSVPDGSVPGGSSNPACDPCFQTLVAETDLCGPALDQCLDDPTLPVEPIVACFQTDGRCYDAALERSAQCNVACGDPTQAQVELCAGQCFLSRADCAERVVRGVDACLSACSGSSCDICSNNGIAAFDDCDADLVSCVDRCKATFRG
ncbi:MAG: hypothetical protein KC933_14975 [Myxococcales bacterium]|nr:hypothetical protein [Myxococcales bacterium]